MPAAPCDAGPEQRPRQAGQSLGTVMADNALTLSRPRMAMRLSRRWMGRDRSADLIPQEGCAQGLQQCRPAWGAAFLCRVWRLATVLDQRSLLPQRPGAS